jgi:hypothetical protein
MQANAGPDQTKPDEKILFCVQILAIVHAGHSFVGIARMNEEGWQIRDWVILQPSAVET